MAETTTILSGDRLQPTEGNRHNGLPSVPGAPSKNFS